ncbi:MAG: hypothetical protein HOQ28_17015 [Thermoleophilia bacterium]|nr:hypothetical protein [Thermoleophilia bacterium]
METLDREAQTRQSLAVGLLGLVTLGWMAGVALGFALADGAGGSLIRTSPQWLTPALQGVIALAITSVAVVLTAISRRIQIRAHVLSQTLPRPLTTH